MYVSTFLNTYFKGNLKERTWKKTLNIYLMNFFRSWLTECIHCNPAFILYVGPNYWIYFVFFSSTKLNPCQLPTDFITDIPILLFVVKSR